MISSVQNTSQNNPYANIVAQLCGVAGGLATQKITKAAISQPINLPLVYKMVYNARTLSPDENQTILNSTKSMLKESGHSDKVTIKLFTEADLHSPENLKRFSKEFRLEEKLKSYFNDPILRDIFVADKSKNPIFSYMNGTNSGFNSGQNRIAVAVNNLLTAPHEAGHAILFNNKKFGRFINDARYIFRRYNVLGKTIALGLLTRKHTPKDDKPLTKMQKFENAIHNNLGLIAVAALIPVLADESNASLLAAKKIKTILPKNLYKKMVNNNKLGFATYTISAIATVISVNAGVKAKDKLADAIKKYYAKKEN